MVMKSGIGSVLQEMTADTDRLGGFAKKKVAESDARVKKMNPKGRKLDKNGNPIVTKEELAKSGMSLRDFLNEERGLTRRVTTSDRIKNDETRKRNTAPVTRAETDARVMAGEKRKRDNAPISRGNVQPDTTAGEAAARAVAPDGGMEAAQEARAYAQRQRAAKLESEYGGGLKGGGSVKGYKSGGKVRGAGIAKRGLGKGRMC